MSYYTYFEGTLNFELETEHFSELQKKIAAYFEPKHNPIRLIENLLEVDAEWNDRGFMEVIVLFIEEKGKLISGNIKCFGETQTDVWEIIINKHQAYIREIGTSTTLHRSEPKLKLYECIKEIEEAS